MPESNSIFIPTRIYERMESIYTHRLTAVCAPENCGKTTFLREFIRRSQSPERSCHFIECYRESANECFAQYCELVLGSREQIPLTENDFLSLREKFDAASCEKPLVIIMDDHVATDIVLGNLYCFRLITEHSPAYTVITCEQMTFYRRRLLGQHDINLISQEDLTLTSSETAEYLQTLGIADSDCKAGIIHKNVNGDILRTKLCARLILKGEAIESYDFYPLLRQAVIKLLPRYVRFAAVCVCAFNFIDEITCENLRSEQALLDFYGSDIIELSTVIKGAEEINRILPNVWINTKTKKYAPPEFARSIVYKGFLKLPTDVKNAFFRCCAKDFMRCGKVFSAICQYCAAGEYEAAAALPANGVVALDYILSHKQSIYEIVISIPLTCKAILPLLVRMLAMLMLTDYKERVRYLFRDIIAHISASDDYTEAERSNILCYTHALRMYEEFYLIEKMGAHIKIAYELFSGSVGYDPPFYSWSLYTPSIFALLYQYSIPTYTQFEQFTRYHRMYAEMICHGEYIEAVYNVEMQYYMGDIQKSLSLALEVTKLCAVEKFVPTGLIACKTAAKCALLSGSCEQYNELADTIAFIARKFSSTETGDMALLCLAMLSCLKHGGDEDIWQVISPEDGVIERNRYTAPFCYYIRCCYMLAHEEHLQLIEQSERYISAAAAVRNETVEMMIRLAVATSHLMSGNTNEAVKSYKAVIDTLGQSEMIMPIAELCINHPMIFRYAAKNLQGEYAAIANRVLAIAKPYSENIETLRTQELTEQFLAHKRSVRITESKRRQVALCADMHRKVKLSEQALRFAALAADGFSNAEIAELTGCSENSIKSSLKRTYQKLGITSRAKLKSALSDIK